MENGTLIFSEWSADIRKYSVAGAVTSVSGWATVYFLVRALSPDRSHEWHCRLVTMMHAYLIVSMAAWSGFVQGPWPFTDPAGPNTPLQCLTCLVTLGYFTFDLAWCLYFGGQGGFMIFHHILSIAGNIVVLYRNINGTEMMATLFGSEITNPVLQLRFFLRYGSPANSFLLGLVDWLFLILFTVMRIIFGSMLLYRYMMHPRPDWLARFFACSIYVVSWIFWLNIVRYAVRKYIFGLLLGRNKPAVVVKSANDADDQKNPADVAVHEEARNCAGDSNTVKKNK